MARVSEHAGYMANYYRWFGTPEAPFGWYYDLLALWAHVSTTSVWMRLPTLLMALACWWVISREVIPRLGDAVKTQQRRGVDRGWHVPGVLAAAQQRAAARADHRAGHPADLVLGRTRGGHQPAAAGGDRVHHRRAHTVLRADRASRRSARCWWRSARCAPSCTAGPGRFGLLPLLAPIVAAGTVTAILIFRDQTLVGEIAGQLVQVAGRPEPELVRRAHPLRAAVHGDPGRLGGAPVRGADACWSRWRCRWRCRCAAAGFPAPPPDRAGASSASPSSRSW